jgi:hypothetical protein
MVTEGPAEVLYGWSDRSRECGAEHGTDTPEPAFDTLRRLSKRTRASGTDWAPGIEARSRALVTKGEAAEPLYREAIERLARTRIRTEHARKQTVETRDVLTPQEAQISRLAADGATNSRSGPPAARTRCSRCSGSTDPARVAADVGWLLRRAGARCAINRACPSRIRHWSAWSTTRRARYRRAACRGSGRAVRPPAWEYRPSRAAWRLRLSPRG